MHQELFFIFWLLLSLDTFLKGLVEIGKDKEYDVAFVCMVMIAVVLSPVVLVGSIISQLFRLKIRE